MASRMNETLKKKTILPRMDRGGGQRPVKRQRTATEPPLASFSELIPAAQRGDAATVASALRNPLIDPNMANQHGSTALRIAAHHGHAPVVTLLLADERVNPNTTDHFGRTPLMFAADHGGLPVLELLLADHRTIRTRPGDDVGGSAYDAALFNVKYPRHARFKGLVRAMVAFRRMRLRAAQAVYAPGGAGFAAAAAHFNAVAAAL